MRTATQAEAAGKAASALGEPRTARRMVSRGVGAMKRCTPMQVRVVRAQQGGVSAAASWQEMLERATQFSGREETWTNEETSSAGRRPRLG